jgi:hypothetical protein
LAAQTDADLGFFIVRDHFVDKPGDPKQLTLPLPAAHRAATDSMWRRDFVRALVTASTLLALSGAADRLDWDRLDSEVERSAPVSSATVLEYLSLNSLLWSLFTSAQSKSSVGPIVRHQVKVLVAALQRSSGQPVRRELCTLIGDLFQLAGEIAFDRNEYTEAAQCYALASSACQQADAFDLWACALTRQAFIGIYEDDFGSATQLLELAAEVARRGDIELSTRHWVSAVHAQSLAGLGQITASRKAMDAAQEVQHLGRNAHNGGWLRFTDDRLAEERGACYVAMSRPDLAEPTLIEAMQKPLSERRRGGVLVDLAMVGVQRGDTAQISTYATTALNTVETTGSGFVIRKLVAMQPRLTPFFDSVEIRNIDRQITAAAMAVFH